MADEGTVQFVHNSQTYHGRWVLEDGIVSVWVGDIGPMATQCYAGGVLPRILARHMIREYLGGQAGTA